MSLPPPAPPGWYADSANSSLLRYWDGMVWTEHTAPGGHPPPQAATPASSATASAGFAPAGAATRTCPYCTTQMPASGSRCPSCAGQLMFCKSCQMQVGTTTKQKFVGMARGGMKTQHRCMQCNRVVDGPRF